MAENTAIEWCDHTINFWWGCQRISPACQNCYAEGTDARYHGTKVTVSTGPDAAMTIRPHTVAPHWGPGPRLLRLEAAEREALRYERRAVKEGTKPLVFVNSMSDFFENHEDLAQGRRFALEVMMVTPHLTYLLLTKRPDQILALLRQALEQAREELAADPNPQVASFVEWIQSWLDGSAPDNIWVGTTVEDQERAETRPLALMAVPAKVRFLSCEPLLGPVTLPEFIYLPRPVAGDWPIGHTTVAGVGIHRVFKNAHGARSVLAANGRMLGIKPEECEDLGLGMNWVIAGGESGPKARVSEPDWFRAMRDQCAVTGTVWSFKQWGEYCPPDQLPEEAFRRWDAVENAAGNPDLERPMRFGKKTSGCSLDGLEHKEFPPDSLRAGGILPSRASA